MKYIFDFDDVLFHNTQLFKPHMYKCLEEAGVPRDVAEPHYKEVRSMFSIKNFVSRLIANEKLIDIDGEKLCEKIMSKNKDFINTELIEKIKKLGKENCYIVTHGLEDYQLDKINSIDILPFFNKIITVQGSKNEEIEKICTQYKNETVVFIDDKAKHFENLNFKKYPNLKTILYTGQQLNF
jgi:FMN phosphatase YigB (HAD superfamily)